MKVRHYVIPQEEPTSCCKCAKTLGQHRWEVVSKGKRNVACSETHAVEFYWDNNPAWAKQ